MTTNIDPAVWQAVLNRNGSTGLSSQFAGTNRAQHGGSYYDAATNQMYTPVYGHGQTFGENSDYLPGELQNVWQYDWLGPHKTNAVYNDRTYNILDNKGEQTGTGVFEGLGKHDAIYASLPFIMASLGFGAAIAGPAAAAGASSAGGAGAGAAGGATGFGTSGLASGAGIGSGVGTSAFGTGLGTSGLGMASPWGFTGGAGLGGAFGGAAGAGAALGAGGSGGGAGAGALDLGGGLSMGADGSILGETLAGGGTMSGGELASLVGAGGGGSSSGGGLLSNLLGGGGGSNNLLGLGASLLGGALGGKGQESEQSTTRDIPEWLKPYVLKQLGYAGPLLDKQMAPGYMQGYEDMRTKGMGLLGRPVARNPFGGY